MLQREQVVQCGCRSPFKKPDGWLTWGLLGVALSPVVIGLTVTALTSAGYEVGHLSVIYWPHILMSNKQQAVRHCMHHLLCTDTMAGESVSLQEEELHHILDMTASG